MELLNDSENRQGWFRPCCASQQVYKFDVFIRHKMFSTQVKHQGCKSEEVYRAVSQNYVQYRTPEHCQV